MVQRSSLLAKTLSFALLLPAKATLRKLLLREKEGRSILRRFCVAVLVAVVLAACGRPSNEVSITRNSDSVLSCFQLSSEYRANLDSIGFNRDESLARERNNLESVAGGLVVSVVVLAGMDLGTAEEAELQTLIARNRRIAGLSEEKACPLLEPDMDRVVAEIEAANAVRPTAVPTRPEDR